MKLNAISLGLAGGVLWGVSIFIMTLLNMWFQYGSLWIQLFSDIYPFYQATPWGSLLGLVWGFVDGFVGCFLLAWLYNSFSSIKLWR